MADKWDGLTMDRYTSETVKNLLADKKHNYWHRDRPGMTVEDQTLRSVYPNDAAFKQPPAFFADYLLQLFKGKITDWRLVGYTVAFEMSKDRLHGITLDVLLIPDDKGKYTPRRLFVEKEMDDWEKRWDKWLDEVNSGNWAFNQLDREADSH